MSLNYILNYSTSSNGPWTQFAGPISATTETVTGLAPLTNYYFQIITLDTSTGLQSSPVTIGPLETPSAVPTPAPTPTPTSTVINGIYVLSNVVASQIAAAPVGVKVVEATSDGQGAFLSSSTVATMTAGGGIVLGYLDCGFCESYRPYYSTAVNAGIIVDPSKPVFGSGQSAEYSVEFWTPTWLNICKSWVSSLITAGFNGVYLDVIDGWNYSGKSSGDPVVVAAGGLSQSANYMTQFISNLRTYAQGINPSFLVWTNGGEELFNPSIAGYSFTVTIPYASVIDGMYKEQVLYNPGPMNAANRNIEKSMLDNAKNAGKPVVLIEYVTGITKVDDVRTTCASWGYGFYIANPNQNLSGVDTEGWVT